MLQMSMNLTTRSVVLLSMNKFSIMDNFNLKQSKGFTLLEVLVAITITALIGAASYWVLIEVIRSQEVLEEHHARLAKLQKVFYIMQQDIAQTVARPVRDEYGERQAAFAANLNNSIELTRHGWLNPLQQTRSELMRVQYLVEDNQLVRKYWFQLDRAQDSEPRTQLLLDGLEEGSFQLLNSKLDWVTSWPELELDEDNSDSFESLPLAIEVTLTVDGLGEIIRLFPLAEPELSVNDS